jgi:hypothetical protein
MEANEEWDHINNESNIIDLFKLNSELHDSTKDETEANTP